jgi:SPW repeat
MAAKWQDWASFALGLWLAVSPWLVGYAEHQVATVNAVTIGLILALGSHFECVACNDLPAEWLNLSLGAWLMGAPFILDFTGTAVASANTLVVGAFVAALAISALSLDKHLGRLLHKRAVRL